ncbi:Sodium- and chloride-dependent glycine transporter 2 [Amphibalanus amphitrite]|uniref:Sodium-and chloride-dependent glycine transporter 2 n=1 Tax=Amphibalanus amphitrite TaxID=1232801 RepID=A0A6A4VX40_AMPAM|nr:Sodium- and chloride-dependent glycine transporter 2 [Amphibalanus amphitrite]
MYTVTVQPLASTVTVREPAVTVTVVEPPPREPAAREAAQRPGGSRMILFNPARTVSRLLESMTERKVREDRGVWGSDGELLAVGCSALVLKGFSYAMLVSLIVIAITYMPVVSSAALYSVEAIPQSGRLEHLLQQLQRPFSNRSFTFNHTRLHQLRTVAGVEFFDRVPYAVIPGLRRAQGAVAISLLVCWMLAALVSQAGAAGVRYTLPFVIGAPLLVVTALTISLLSSQRAARAALSLLAIDPSTGLGVNSFIYSRNMLTHNCKRSAVTLIAVKFAVSVICVVCYALMAGTHAVEVGEEARELTAAYGDHHALVRLTSTLGMLPDSENWSVLMLLAIVLAGLGFVQIVLLTIEASLRELSLVRGLSTRAVVLLLCAVFFVVDAVSTVQGSYFTFLSVYQHVSVYISIALTTALLVAVNSTLSVERLLDDLRDAMNVSMRWSFNYWGISWCIVCPVLLVVLFFGTVVEEAMLPGRPLRGEVTGWTFSVSGLLAAGPVCLLLGYVLVECRRTERFDSELDVCAPTRHWRPGLLDECAVRQQPSQEVIDKSSQALMTSKSSLMTYVYSPVIGWSTEDLASKGGGSRGRSPAAEP